MKYRSKVSEVDAVQWNGVSFDPEATPVWLRAAAASGWIYRKEDRLFIQVNDSVRRVEPHDWVILSAEGEICACSDALFARKYEACL